MQDDPALWEQVRGEVRVLERELSELERENDSKQRTIAEMRAAQQRERDPGSLAQSSGAAEVLTRLMEELRAAQLGIKAESERHLQLSEAIDRHNTELYQTSTYNHTVRNERVAAASQLAALAQEQQRLAAQLQDLRREEDQGETQLRTFAQMQTDLTRRLHEAQALEIASQGVS